MGRPIPQRDSTRGPHSVRIDRRGRHRGPRRRWTAHKVLAGAARLPDPKSARPDLDGRPPDHQPGAPFGFGAREEDAPDGEQTSRPIESEGSQRGGLARPTAITPTSPGGVAKGCLRRVTGDSSISERTHSAALASADDVSAPTLSRWILRSSPMLYPIHTSENLCSACNRSR